MDFWLCFCKMHNGYHCQVKLQVFRQWLLLHKETRAAPRKTEAGMNFPCAFTSVFMWQGLSACNKERLHRAVCCANHLRKWYPFAERTYWVIFGKEAAYIQIVTVPFGVPQCLHSRAKVRPLMSISEKFIQVSANSVSPESTLMDIACFLGIWKKKYEKRTLHLSIPTSTSEKPWSLIMSGFTCF